MMCLYLDAFINISVCVHIHVCACTCAREYVPVLRVHRCIFKHNTSIHHLHTFPSSETLTFPSRFSCTISWSELPIPIKAQTCVSCSLQPSRSICSCFLFQPLPNRYIHGGGQKNLATIHQSILTE